jgi:hypothetical protein
MLPFGPLGRVCAGLLKPEKIPPRLDHSLKMRPWRAVLASIGAELDIHVALHRVSATPMAARPLRIPPDHVLDSPELLEWYTPILAVGCLPAQKPPTERAEPSGERHERDRQSQIRQQI